tara:strand:+ start:266 stop:475 length:210 start_codon:yes stop_codon:yes gene_type:complete
MANTNENSMVFHAETTIKNNKVVSNRGRERAVIYNGKNLETAPKTSYKNLYKIYFESFYCQKELGQDVM